MDEVRTDDLRGRTALVTGAGGGIGRAISVRLAAHGVRLYVAGLDRDRLDMTIGALRDVQNGDAALAGSMAADLTEPGMVRHLADAANAELGALDILVHAAGIYRRGLLEETSLSDVDELYRANVRVPYELTQATLAGLTHSHGDIVFVNSTQGLSATAKVSGFAATQQAMKALGESLRVEVNSRGVRVTTIHLGRTATTRQEGIFAAEGREYNPELLLQPEDVADVVVSAVSLPRRAQITSVTLLPTQDVGAGPTAPDATSSERTP